MTWFKVDDGFWSHPKTADLSAAAVALWVKSGAYSSQHLTDGRISKKVLRLLGTAKAARELVNAGMWIATTDGWVFHDWAEYQETSDDVLKRRADAKERQRRSREERDRKRREHAAKSQDLSHVTNTVTHSAPAGASARVNPTRPDPTNISNSPSDDVSPEQREATSSSEFADGTPIPDDPGPEVPTAIETGSRRSKPQPTDSARQLVREIVGTADFDRDYRDRLAVQVDKLARAGRSPELIREVLREWLARSDVRTPEGLSSVANDVAKRSRGRPSSAGTVSQSVDGWLEISADAEQFAHNTHKELT